MSYLDVARRPMVLFDPQNKQHREWVSKFLQTQAWSHCPVRFVVLDDSISTFAVIQRQLTDYYIKKEFGKIAVDNQEC